MSRLLQLWTEHWLSVTLLILACVPIIRVAFKRSFWPIYFSLIALIGIGYFLSWAVPYPYRMAMTWLVRNGLIDSIPLQDKPRWIVAGYFFLMVCGTFLLKGAILYVSGRWSQRGALLLASLMLVLFSAGLYIDIQQTGAQFLRTLPSLQFVQPWYLLLLLLIPVLLYYSWHSLAGLGPVRSKVSLGVRCLVVLCIVLALAEPRIKRPNEYTTVLYLIDRSLSIPTEFAELGENEEPVAITRTDLRWNRIQNFIDEAVMKRGANHRNDASGVILFGRRPRLVLPPGVTERLVVRDNMAGNLDPNYTDIAAALKLAMASFPEGSSKRIVLLSDGNENLGNAEEQAAIARQNGVQIDVIPLAEGYRQQNEVMIQEVVAPAQTTKGARVPIRVLVRNSHPSHFVDGRLELLQNRDGTERPIAMVGRDEKEKSPYEVRLAPGLNSFVFRDKAEIKGDQDEASYSYRAVFTPTRSVDRDGRLVSVGLPGDRIQNNKGLAHVIAKGSRKVLFIDAVQNENRKSPHQYLIDRLRLAKYNVTPITVGRLPLDKGEATVFLSNYDCVIISDVPADLFSREQMEAIRSNTYDQGAGLIMIGGPDSFGAGGYQKTPIEAALPVECDIKALKAAGRGGLVLIMHGCEIAEANKWEKEVAKLSLDRLTANDMFGILYWGGFGGTKWHIPFAQIGDKKGDLKSKIDSMSTGDMMDFDSHLQQAADVLSEPAHGLATKHVIVISDGDPQLGAAGKKALSQMKTNGITLSAVGMATHSAAEDKKMIEMVESAFPGGKYYNPKSGNELPAIYMRESRRVSQSFIAQSKFQPKLEIRDGPTEKMPDNLPLLHGFVRTTLKTGPLVQRLISAPKVFDQEFPILATWQYGIGRAAAFTSDAKTLPQENKLGWDRDWAASEIYLKFWEQTVGWCMRGLETDRLVMTTEYRDGKVKVVVEARDDNNKPIVDLKLEGTASTPVGLSEGSKPISLKFEQKAGGYYEAEFKAEEAGSYVVTAQAKQVTEGFKGRYRDALPKTVTEKDGELFLADGTPVRKLPNGTYVYADDGKPVVVQEKAERVVDSRRAAVTVSYSPEFSELETNTALLKRLAEITGGKVYSEDPESLKKLAQSGEIYRPAPNTVRTLLPIWFWLVFLAGILFFFDVAVRRVSLEPHEVQKWASAKWIQLRKSRLAKSASETGPDDPFLARLRERKSLTGEQLEKKASRKFEADPNSEGAIPQAPPGADEDEEDDTEGGSTGMGSKLPPSPPKPAPTQTPSESDSSDGEDYFAKLRSAKKRAPK